MKGATYFVAKELFSQENFYTWKLKGQEIITQRNKNEKAENQDYSVFIVDVLMYVSKAQNHYMVVMGSEFHLPLML